jgi:hypothetical protein
MKGNFLHIGTVVLGFVFAIQGANAQMVPDEDFDLLAQIYPEEVSQIDAEEASGESASGEVTTGNEGSRIRFSDFEEVAPAIQEAPSPQSFSAQLSYGEIEVFGERIEEEFSIRDGDTVHQRYQQNSQDQSYQRDQQYQRNQQQNQNRQQQGQQNQGRQNQWELENGTICPNTDDQRCFYPDSQRKRCEMFDGVYIDGVCYMKDDSNLRHDECESQGGIYVDDQCYRESEGMNDRNRGMQRDDCEDMGGMYRQGSCPIKYDSDKYQRNSRNGGEDEDLLASIIPLVRTEARKQCEEKGGEYIGNQKCIIRHYDQDKCEDKDGTYYNGECFIDSDDL